MFFMFFSAQEKRKYVWVCVYIEFGDLYLLAICFILFQGGLGSGYKKNVADKGLTDESYTADSIALIRISGTSIHNNKVVQVDAVCFLSSISHGVDCPYNILLYFVLRAFWWCHINRDCWSQAGCEKELPKLSFS